MPKPLDGKAYGVLYTQKDNQIIPPDEFIVFRVHDKALLPTLQFYQSECIRIGAELPQLEAVDDLIDRVIKWQALHPERMKLPDVVPNELSR